MTVGNVRTSDRKPLEAKGGCDSRSFCWILHLLGNSWGMGIWKPTFLKHCEERAAGPCVGAWRPGGVGLAN